MRSYRGSSAAAAATVTTFVVEGADGGRNAARSSVFGVVWCAGELLVVPLKVLLAHHFHELSSEVRWVGSI